MASFIIKQMVGDKVSAITDSVKDTGGEENAGNAEEDPEIVAAREEAERKRQDKHRKMEEEREAMRQGIREKFNIKKKEDAMDFIPPPDGRIGRQKKTPAELAADLEDDDDEFDPVKMATNLFNTFKAKLPF
ncbi:hypothetical protein SNEBB_004848 [Seison nebaliae]|nr:hypothetical protein SNEBB_004848 [Seison nebaliae]